MLIYVFDFCVVLDFHENSVYVIIPDWSNIFFTIKCHGKRKKVSHEISAPKIKPSDVCRELQVFTEVRWVGIPQSVKWSSPGQMVTFLAGQ